jgi:hypothetical protein
MSVIYLYYEPEKGFEEIQAEIYNDELRRNLETAFLTVFAEQITQRYKSENKDPKGVRYALKKDGSPLAYIQTTISESPPRVWIGFPWALKNCPVEVQEKLFTEMLEYVQEKHPEREVVMGYLSESWKNQNDFAKKKGFRKIDEAYFYSLKTDSVDIKVDEEFTTKIGNPDDLDILIELSKADPEINSAFPDERARISYFKNRVLPDGHTILVFKDDQLICASAPLKGYYTGIMFRFLAIRPGFEKAYRTLVTKMAVHCKEQQWEEPLLLTSFTKWELSEPIVKELGANLIDRQILYGLKE